MTTVLRAILILSVLCAFAAAQTAVEYTLKSSSTPPTSAGFKRIGGKLSSTLERAGGKAGVILVDPPTKARQRPPAEDPSNITTGLSTEELLKRFGDPDLKTSAPDGSTKFWYSGVIAMVEKDKVVAVSKTEKANPAVVVLQ